MATTDRLRTYDPTRHVVWCERCQRWTTYGQPYEMLRPGVFTHRLCAVPAAGDGGE